MLPSGVLKDQDPWDHMELGISKLALSHASSMPWISGDDEKSTAFD